MYRFHVYQVAELIYIYFVVDSSIALYSPSLFSESTKITARRYHYSGSSCNHAVRSIFLPFLHF